MQPLWYLHETLSKPSLLARLPKFWNRGWQDELNHMEIIHCQCFSSVNTLKLSQTCVTQSGKSSLPDSPTDVGGLRAARWGLVPPLLQWLALVIFCSVKTLRWSVLQPSPVRPVLLWVSPWAAPWTFTGWTEKPRGWSMCCWWEDYCVWVGDVLWVSGANFSASPSVFFRLFRFVSSFL